MTTVARILLPGGDLETPRGELVELTLPDRAGLLLERQPTGSAARTDLHFVAVRRGELARVALDLAERGHARSIVVCPVGVSPGRTALALAVGGCLRDRRGGGRTVVTCPVGPPLGEGRSAVPHEVQVAVGGVVQCRLVWELVDWERLPAWLAALR
jgi:hypothetical protein